MHKVRPRNIIIPDRIIKRLPALAEKILRKFKKNRQSDAIEYIDSVFLDTKHRRKKRRVPIYIGEEFDTKKKKYEVLASYYGNDCICVFRGSIKKAGSRARKLHMIQRILAHEIAHAIDRSRILRMGKNNPKAAGTDKGRIKYVCHPIEYDAEIASIAQVAVPYMLSQRYGQALIIDLFTNNKRLWPLSKYKPFWSITFNGYLADWSFNDEVCQRFFHDLMIAVCDSLHHLKSTKRLEDTDHPIIKACLRKIRSTCSPTSGDGRNSARSSRARRSFVSSRRSGSESDESGGRNTGSIFFPRHGRRSARAA